MFSRPFTVAAVVTIASIALVGVSLRSVNGGSSTVGMNAAERAAGNRIPAARSLGDSLLQANWPAQLTKIRVDGAGSHAVAGLVVSGVKFHRKLDAAGFTSEVVSLVDTAFEQSKVEEVDVWATVPLPVRPNEVVAGDLAEPTSRVVYAVTVERGERKSFAERLHAGTGVFWDSAWRSTISQR